MVSLELAGVSSPRPGKIKVDAIEELDAGESGKARARFGVTWSSRLGAALLLVAAGAITKFCKRRSRRRLGEGNVLQGHEQIYKW